MARWRSQTTCGRCVSADDEAGSQLDDAGSAAEGCMLWQLVAVPTV
jgi:hypothetical protein